MEEIRELKVKKIDLVHAGANNRRHTLFKAKGEEGEGTGGTARRLIRQLEEAGLTHEEIGNAVNRSASVIGQIKRNEIHNPPESLITRLRRLASSRTSKSMDLEKLKKEFESASDEERAELLKALGHEEPRVDEDSIAQRVLKSLGIRKDDTEDPLEDASEPVRKAVTELGEELKASNERVEKLQKEIEARDAKERRQSAIKKAQSLDHMNFTADEDAEAFEKLAKADPEAFEHLYNKLASLNSQVDTSKLFEEIGKGGPPDGSARAVVKSKEDDLRKANPELTPEQARARIWRENPELAIRYQEETEGA